MESAPVRVRLFGGLAVDGVGDGTLGSRKARAVLARLTVARGEPVSVDQLCEVAWGDSLPSRPGAQLSVLVSRLRAVLGRERIGFDDRGYRLHADSLDLAEFDELIDEAIRRDGTAPTAAAAAATAALNLIRGTILPEFTDTPWLDLERAAIERRSAIARHIAARCALSTRHFDVAAGHARAALDTDPFDEEALRLLMTTLVRTGRRGAALDAYAAVRAHLVETLGADPSPETESLHDAILRDEIVDDSHDPSESTPPGRGAIVADLLAELRAPFPRSTWLALTGEPGIGKTTILRALGEHGLALGTILASICGESAIALPLQPIVDAIDDHLRVLGREGARELLGDDLAVVGPLFRSIIAVNELPEAVTLTSAPVGLLVLYSALVNILGRLERPWLLLDDLHLAPPATIACLAHLHHHVPDLAIISTHRLGEGAPVPADRRVDVGPLDLAAVEGIVGIDRAESIFDRSGGNPLLIRALADADDDVPHTIVEAVAAWMRALGPAAPTIAAAAVLDRRVDVELVASVLGCSALAVLEHLEAAEQRGMLVDDGEGFSFTHALFREAIVETTTTARRSLLHREAGRYLAASRRDPLTVSYHARRGGDRELAATALLDAARIAVDRFDHREAIEMIDLSLALHQSDAARLQRARALILVEDFAAAYDEALSVNLRTSSTEADEIAGWSAYYQRDFATAALRASNGVRAAVDDQRLRASCQVLAGRIHHALGDLEAAAPLFEESARVAVGADRIVATTWLGAVRAHEGQPELAVALLDPITRGEVGGQLTTPLLHALIFLGHAHAALGRADRALVAFDRYDTEVERRAARRYAGRANNFRAWILRSLGSDAEADDENRAALDAPAQMPETVMAAHLDLAESALMRGDIGACHSEITRACEVDSTRIVFGWRQRLKADELRIRAALASDLPADALTGALQLERDAGSVERYALGARLLAARAAARLGEPVDLDSVERDLQRFRAVMGIEGWWRTGEVAMDLGVDRWRDDAERWVARLLPAADRFAPDLERAWSVRFG